jgi:hypothetical protein
LETNRRNCEEINGHQLSDMIAKKRHPSLRGLSLLWHQSRNRPLGNLKPEFQQLAMDAWGSPDGIGGSCSANQSSYLEMHSRAAWSFRLGQSPPVPLESPALPSGTGFRVNEYESRSQFVQSAFRAIQNHRSRSRNRGRFFSRVKNGQLMTQCDVFQGDLLVTTEDEDEESNRYQK